MNRCGITEKNSKAGEVIARWVTQNNVAIVGTHRIDLTLSLQALKRLWSILRERETYGLFWLLLDQLLIIELGK